MHSQQFDFVYPEHVTVITKPDSIYVSIKERNGIKFLVSFALPTIHAQTKQAEETEETEEESNVLLST